MSKVPAFHYYQTLIDQFSRMIPDKKNTELF